MFEVVLAPCLETAEAQPCDVISHSFTSCKQQQRHALVCTPGVERMSVSKPLSLAPHFAR